MGECTGSVVSAPSGCLLDSGCWRRACESSVCRRTSQPTSSGEGPGGGASGGAAYLAGLSEVVGALKGVRQ